MQRTLIHVDLNTRTWGQGQLPQQYQRLGGRALTSRIVADEVDPQVNALSSENLLVLAPGLLAGTALSSANRLSAGAKSPLTGTIKESNCGGVVAHKLGRLGIGAIKLSGTARSEGALIGIRVTRDGVTFEDLSDLKGMDTYTATDALLERYGRKAGVLVIGPAGENRMLTACINVNDPEGEPCRNLGRGGLGAVMGSKGVKAIIIDDAGTKPSVAQPDNLKATIRAYVQALREHPVTGERFAMYGTAATLTGVNALGGLPTKNFRTGVFDNADRIGGERLHETIKSRGGQFAHSCMPGCVIRCSNKYVDADGNPVVGSVDYETLCLMGSNLGLGDLDQVAELNRLCNEIGIDTIETGATLGVLADSGFFDFGDFEKIKELVLEISAGSPIGRIIGSGAASCGRVFGAERIPTVKNQAMAAYDPRTIKGMGLTYAQSPMGADHTAGNAIVLDVDHSDPSVQLAPVRDLNIKTTVLDAMGLCIFTARVTLANTELIEQMVRGVHGWDASFDDLMDLAKSTLLLERNFNTRAGFTREDDRLPRFMRTEKLPPHNGVADVPEETIDRFYDWQ